MTLAVVFADLRSAIGFSAFTVPTYYAVTNASALTLKGAERRWPRWVPITGLTGCAVLALTLPVQSVIAGTAVWIAGAVVFLVRHRFQTGNQS